VHDHIGGFESYRGEVLDDCALFERIKDAGFRVRVVDGYEFLRSKMYRDFKDLFWGFSKNSFAALGRRWSLVALLTTAIVASLVTALVGIFGESPALIAILPTIWTTLAVAGIRLHAPFYYYPFAPISLPICVFIVLFSALTTGILNGVPWKGRVVK
jgi:chlorobactene glucosyltransferase